MPRPAPLITAALAAGLVLTACQKPEVSGPPVSPTALPSSTPTAPNVGTTAPTAASSPASPSPVLITWKPTTKAEEEALAKEAEQVYRAFVKEQVRLEAEGGFSGELPPSIARFVVGREAEALRTSMNGIHAAGVKLLNPEAVKVVAGATSFSQLSGGELIQRRFCNDATKAVATDSAGKKMSGQAVHLQAVFVRPRPGDSLRLARSTKEVRTTCEL